MKKATVLWAAGVGLLALFLAARHTPAAVDAETNKAINEVADLLEKGNLKAAQKAAKAVADKSDIEDFMNGFKLRSKKGIGVGAKANEVVPDGIELKYDAIARDGIKADALKKEGPALVRMGQVTAAIAHIAHAKAPLKDMGKQKKADWIEWSQNLARAAEDFSAAAKGTSPNELKKAAAKIKQSCDSCHAVFK